MKHLWCRRIAVCVMIIIAELMSVCLEAQSLTDIKVMSYNLLAFPEGDIAAREDTLAKILNYYRPDIFLVQELRSEEGLQKALAACQSVLGASYQAGVYIPQISDPDNTSWRLQQNIIVNGEHFDIAAQETLLTLYRDINYFKLYWRDSPAADSVFLHCYVTHLKSSSGTENQQIRLEMAKIMRQHAHQLPPQSLILVAGDFNLYSGSEPAYQWLLADSGNNDNTLQDPINTPNWASASFTNTAIYTQSTRSSGFSDGASGGIDDRFDFVLLSETLLNGDSAAPLHYQNETYKALGNNGTCYNQDIINCAGGDNPVSEDILHALWYMSDHLPVTLTLQATTPNDTTAALPTTVEPAAPLHIFQNKNNNVLFSWQDDTKAKLHLYDLNGRLLQTFFLQPYESRSLMLATGCYAAQIMDMDKHIIYIKKIIIH